MKIWPLQRASPKIKIESKIEPQDDLKTALETVEKKTKIWLKRNNLQIDKQKHLLAFENTVADLQEKLLEISLRGYATANAAQNAKLLLTQGLNLQEADLDTERINNMIIVALQVEIFNTILRSTKLSLKTRRQLVDRLIKRILPLRDNMAQGTPISPQQLLKTHYND